VGWGGGEGTTIGVTHRGGNHSNNNILKRKQIIYIFLKYSSFLQKGDTFYIFSTYVYFEVVRKFL